MILGLIYSLLHLLLGCLAAVWTVKRLRRAGYLDGCFVFFCALVAFVFWPFALAVLMVDWAVDQMTERD